MPDKMTQKSLEAEINEERSELAQTLTSFIDGFKPASLIESLEGSAPEIAQKALNNAKENPLAVGVIGAGLAMLAYGSKKPAPTQGQAWQINDRADPLKVKLSETRQAVTQTADQMRAALYDGTAELSDVARARIVDARRKAVEAQTRIEDSARAASASSRDIFDDKPLAVCAGILAAGALAALALPRTRFEDDTFGGHRDAMVHHAEAVFHEEVERAMAQGQEAVSAAQEALRSVPNDRPNGAAAAS